MNGPAPRVFLLDGFRVLLDVAGAATTVPDLPYGVQRLIAHLSLCGRPARGALAGQLWPDVPEAHAQGSLRTTLWRVQKAVPGLVAVSGGTVTLTEGVRVDVREVVDWARAVLDHAGPVDHIGPWATARAGTLLPGWSDDWVLLERERLRQLRLHALEVLAERLALAGRYGEALQAARAAVRDEPLRESAHRALVRVHLARGDTAEAMRAYGTFRQLLLRELGVPPTRRMQELVHGGHVRTVARHRGLAAVPMPRRSAVAPPVAAAPRG